MADTAIRTEGLAKRFGVVEALAGLDLEVGRGEVLGYLGPNGAGKTTTIRLLLDLARPTAGRAEVFGFDTQRQAVAVHRRLAYVPGEAALWPSLTGAETLHLLGRVHGSFDSSYRDELIGRFDLDPAKRVRAYSKGNRQKLSLVAAFMSRADLLILDEPTSGLDPLMEQVFRQCVLEAKGRGQTVLLSSHVLSEVEVVCDRVAILRRGRLVETGTLAELRHLAAVSVDAVVTGPAPDLSRLPGVSHLRIDGNRLQCQVSGPVEEVLGALTRAGVDKLLIREPSLEELFLAHYGADGVSPAAGRVAGGR
jgi:ABC-2 type transport system ATP-binding protein